VRPLRLAVTVVPIAHLEAIVINCHEPGTLAPFYSRLLGLPIDPADEAAIAAGTLAADESVLLGSRAAMHVWLTPVTDLQPAPGRVHLDVRLDSAGDLEAIIAMGAVRCWEGPGGRWTVLADPQGNLFCVINPESREPAPSA
jgi:predicted enzyme related to lactoylglutathione lyase